MLKLYLSLRHLWADKRGVTAIEYAVLAGAISVALTAVFLGTNGGDTGVFSALTTAIEDAFDESPASTN